MFSSTISLSFSLLLASFARAAIIDVTVGGPAGLQFTPEAVAAQVGDQVVFHFEQKNHTATRSSFADPCGMAPAGFDSGFMPVGANVTANFPTYTITVNDMQPIWVYCRQAANTPASHCGQGMVFAVNCGADGSPNSFTNFKNAALAVGAALNAAASSSAAGFTAPAAGSTVPAVAPTVPAATTTAAVTATATAVATTTGTAAAATHSVIVGGTGILAYNPPHLAANPGDVVVFEFHQKNHTVTQSSFGAPCQKLQSTSTTGQIGFDSGFMPVADNSTTFPTFSITVNDTNPVWAYCRQATHCGSGMVFAINSVENGPKNFNAFQTLAKQLNGTSSTATASGSSASATTGSTSGSAPRFGVGLGLSMTVVGVVFTLFL